MKNKKSFKKILLITVLAIILGGVVGGVYYYQNKISWSVYSVEQPLRFSGEYPKDWKLTRIPEDQPAKLNPYYVKIIELEKATKAKLGEPLESIDSVSIDFIDKKVYSETEQLVKEVVEQMKKTGIGGWAGPSLLPYDFTDSLINYNYKGFKAYKAGNNIGEESFAINNCLVDIDVNDDYRVRIVYSGGINHQIMDCKWKEESEATKIIDKIVDSIKIE